MKHKKKGIKRLKKNAWIEFSKYIRTRDCLKTTGCTSWGLCITCGRRYHFKLLQSGHFISGRHNANLFHEKGCHAQCYNCNINLKGNTLAYMDKLISMYGKDIIEELRENDRKILQFKPEQLERIKDEYKKKTKELEELKNAQ